MSMKTEKYKLFSLENMHQNHNIPQQAITILPRSKIQSLTWLTQH